MSTQVLHATAWYAPHQVGGTEVYVQGLVEALAGLGIAGTVLTPRVPGVPARYDHAGHPVETYPERTSAQGRAGREPRDDGLRSFRRLLTGFPKAIYHQHSWTPDCGLAHLMAARALGLRTVLTVHVPANLCLRGTMLHFGDEPCSGIVQARSCGACWAQGMGMPRGLATTVAKLPLAAAERLRRLPSRLATGLGARSIGVEREHMVRAMIASADRIVAVCGWLSEALLANGVPAERLVLSRHGLPDALAAQMTASVDAPMGPLSLLYLGRFDSVKGVDVLVRAVRATQADLQLTVRGIAQGDRDEAYARRVRAMAGEDRRIRFAPPVSREDVAAEMARYDVLAVPSQCMETGPLVVLEARAAGLFVLGSHLGGISELLAGVEDAQLIEVGSVAAWMEAIESLAARGVRRGRPTRVRTMSEAAVDMADLYSSI